jgi:hypothetical protein
MPKLTATKEELKGPPLLPEGLYTIRMAGFKPQFSKDKGSVNLTPQLKIINHPDYNDRSPGFENLNTKAKFLWQDFCHAFGVPLQENPANGELEFPGDFSGPDNDPTKWDYSGPLLGQVGQVYVVQADNTRGQDVNKIKFYVCKVPGCTERHSKDLAK